MKKQILVNSRWLKVIRESIRFPNGKVVPDFYTVERPTYAAVVSLLNNREIILVQQYRHGPRQTILNLPMGVIAKNEKPIAAARRELLEETGYLAKNISLIGTFQNNPAFLRLKCHLFLAQKLTAKTKHVTDANEHTAMIRLPLEAALQKIFDGEIQDMTTVIGIFAAYMSVREKTDISRA